MEPSEVAAWLRSASAVIYGHHGYIDMRDKLERLADSFDQPGPLAYSEAEGKLVRLEPLLASEVAHDGLPAQVGWRFPPPGEYVIVTDEVP